MLGECKLCDEKKSLRNSHIIPEWAYKPLYDEDHKFYRVDSQSHSQIRHQYKGEYERLLCESCESDFAEYDEYGRAVIYSEPGQPTFGIEYSDDECGFKAFNVDYRRWKLFQISVLWRQAVSTRPIFANFSLDGKEQALKRMLVCGSPGRPDEFGCIVSPVLSGPRDLFDKVIKPPRSFVQGGLEFALLFFAGCNWIYLLSTDSRKFPFRNQFSSPGQPVILRPSKLQDFPGLMRDIDDLGAALQ